VNLVVVVGVVGWTRGRILPHNKKFVSNARIIEYAEKHREEIKHRNRNREPPQGRGIETIL
jgi:hypothetical protein